MEVVGDRDAERPSVRQWLCGRMVVNDEVSGLVWVDHLELGCGDRTGQSEEALRIERPENEMTD